MTATRPPLIRISDPAELIGAVPYLLGFHPHESLVIVGLAGTKVIVTARLDLAGVAHPRVLADCLDALRQGDATKVVAVVFTERHGLIDDLTGQMVAESCRVGIAVAAVLIVTSGRWRSLMCTDETCCPPEGKPLPGGTTALAAAAAYAGLTVLPDRAALAGTFAPLPGRPDLTAGLLRHHTAQLGAVLDGDLDSYDRSVIRALFAAHRAAQAGRMSTDEQVARYAVALQPQAVRDALWLAVDDGCLAGIELWVNLARRLPHPYDAPPLFLAGWRAYRDGNGALARIAADLAGQADPSYQAPELLLAVLDRGIDPHSLPKLGTPATTKDEADRKDTA